MYTAAIKQDTFHCLECLCTLTTEPLINQDTSLKRGHIVHLWHSGVSVSTPCSCQEMVGSNIRELIIKMLETEKEDWYEQQPPEEDINGAYYSTIGITLFQMIDQNV